MSRVITEPTNSVAETATRNLRRREAREAETAPTVQSGPEPAARHTTPLSTPPPTAPPPRNWWNVSTYAWRRIGFKNGVVYAYVVKATQVYSRPLTKHNDGRHVALGVGISIEHNPNMRSFERGEVVLGSNWVQSRGLWLNITTDESKPEYLPIDRYMEQALKVELPYGIEQFFPSAGMEDCAMSPYQYQIMLNYSLPEEYKDALQAATDNFDLFVKLDSRMRDACLERNEVRSQLSAFLESHRLHNPDVPWGEGAAWVKNASCVDAPFPKRWPGVPPQRQWRYDSCKGFLHKVKDRDEGGGWCEQRRSGVLRDGFCAAYCGLCRSPNPVAQDVVPVDNTGAMLADAEDA